MFSSFQRPNNGWLVFFSILWLVLGLVLVIMALLKGNLLFGLLMLPVPVCAAGLWFGSRLSAIVLILFVVAGGVYTLFQMRQLPPLRVIWRLCYAAYSIYLLIEYLNEDRPG